MGLLVENWGGTSFDSLVNYVVAGRNMSTQVDVGDIQLMGDDYENGRVYGHAFYELAQAVGIDIAAAIYVRSIQLIADSNSSGSLDFNEIRTAQISAVTVLGYSTSVKNAVKNAWADVGVGSPAPLSPPAWLFTSSKGCYHSLVLFNLFFDTSPSAPWYQVFRNTGSGWYDTADPENSPVPLSANSSSTLKVRSCNTAGCSGFSYSITHSYYNWQCNI